MGCDIIEEWKQITLHGCSLDISNYGNVRYSINKKPKAYHLNKYGYPTIHIQKGKKVYAYRIHRLVALLFIENPIPDKYDCINHKDENHQNNRVDNLEWCDRRYNNNYGTHNKKIAQSKSKPIIQYDLSGNIIKEWASATIAAKELSFSQSSINWCCLHKPRYNSYKGCIWRYKDDKSDISYKNGKRVIMLSLDGNPIKEFFNITQACYETQIKITSIVNCLRGRSKSAGGYKWIYKK